jgi:phage terminase large subunit GpA-like protein
MRLQHEQSSRPSGARSTKHLPRLQTIAPGYLAKLARLMMPPPTLTVSQWADRFRRLSSESSAESGQWRTDRAPYQRGIMDAVRDEFVTEVVVMKSAQVGWTEILGNVVGYHVHQEPAPILLLQPTLEMAESWSKDRLAPMIRDTPCLRGSIADPRSRDSGNTLLHKRFPGGHLTIVGANSPSSLASRPIRVLLCDEVDRFPTSAGTEGDPIDLARRRTATFRNRKILMGSTPTIKGASRIEAAFEQSDQRFYFLPCTHCGEFQRLIWSQLQWPEGRPEAAAYACQHCGALLTDADKLAMLPLGEWRASKPSTGVAGFHISELYSPWSSWPEMATAFLRAKRLPETLQTWINTALGETWEEKGESIEAAGLLQRREAYTGESLPDGVLLLTAGTDVQDDRLEVTIWGWGAEEEAWRVDHVVLRGDPGGTALWAEHDTLLRRRFRTEDQRELVIEACAVDSGGHFTEQVYRYCAARKRFRVWAIKGIGGPGRLAWPKKASRGAKIRVELWPIGVDTIKDLLYGRLKKITEPGPGYMHFDAGTSEDWFDQLTSETVVWRMVQGRKVRQWKPKRAGVRQEALDSTVYAYAAMVGRGGVRVLATRGRTTWAPPAAETMTGDAPAPAAEPLREQLHKERMAPARRSWMKRYRW